MAGLFENWPNFLQELAGKLGQDLATLGHSQITKAVVPELVHLVGHETDV